MRTKLVTLAFAAPVRLEQMNSRVARRLSGFGHDLAPFVFEQRRHFGDLIWRGELLGTRAAQVASRHRESAKEVAIAHGGKPQPAST